MNWSVLSIVTLLVSSWSLNLHYKSHNMKDLPTTSSFSLGKLYRICKRKLKAVSKHNIYCDLNPPSCRHSFCKLRSVKYNKPFVTALTETRQVSATSSETGAVLNKILPPKGWWISLLHSKSEIRSKVSYAVKTQLWQTERKARNALGALSCVFMA